MIDVGECQSDINNQMITIAKSSKYIHNSEKSNFEHGILVHIKRMITIAKSSKYLHDSEKSDFGRYPCSH